MTRSDSFLARYANAANANRHAIAAADEAMVARHNVDTGDIVEDLISDKIAQGNLIDAQATQIRTLTTMLRALGHYGAGVGFNG